ncbi:MAG: hypothetical protein M0R17_02925 [Candidatus Omnitrophica bacterium]|jgi:hypothetical protein|nr:hypothetical protein [Candidatus Omnitrophota bacterium]
MNKSNKKQHLKTLNKYKLKFKEAGFKLIDYKFNEYVEYNCVCGKLLKKPYSYLFHTYSCGCLFYQYKKGKDNYRFKGYKELSARTWIGIKNNAKTRKIKFNISIEQAVDLLYKQNHKCILSGLPINLGDYRNKNKTASLDRIDSSKSYNLDNIRWIHKDINKMKLNLSNDIFLYFCYLIINPIKNKITNIPVIKQNRSFSGYKNLYKTQWSDIEKKAKIRNLEFSITIEDAYKKFEKQQGYCALTGLPITLGYKKLSTASLDRIDNSIGYTLSNIQWIHKKINIALKQGFSEKYLKKICKIITIFNKDKIKKLLANNRNCPLYEV